MKSPEHRLDVDISRTSLSYPAVVLQQLQLVTTCTHFEIRINYTKGMLQSGLYRDACSTARVLVEQAIDALIFGAGLLHWSATSSHKWRLQRLAQILGRDSPVYQEAQTLLVYPVKTTKQAAHRYFDSCLNFGLNVVGMRKLGIPSGEIQTEQGQGERYEFVRRWGKEALELGIESAYPLDWLLAALHGGRGSVRPPLR